MPSDLWLTNRKVVHLLAFKLHVWDKEFVSICTGHPTGMTRVQQREITTARIMNKYNNERVNSAAALVAVQQRDPEYIKKQRLQNDVAMNLVARTQIKSKLDHVNSTRMKLELLQNNKGAMVAKYGEAEYNNRVTDLIDRLETPPAVNNHEEVITNIDNDNAGNLSESA